MVTPTFPVPPTSAVPPRNATAALRYALVVATLVGSIVTAGHLAFPGHRAWPWIHLLLPVTVFSWSALRSGPVTRSVVLRGIVVVGLVFVLFSLVNGGLETPWFVRGGLNFLIPLVVSFVGARSGTPGGTRDA